MIEKRTEVKTHLVRLMCDKCDGGELLPMGYALMTSPPKYPHKCNKCGHEESQVGRRYPLTEIGGQS